MSVANTIILSLDGIELERSLRLVSQVANRVYAVKVHDLVDFLGAKKTISQLRFAGAPRVWVDYKFHDIPQTVALRVRAICCHNPDILTVHASGGVQMMEAAIRATQTAGRGRAEVYAVTLLTSLSPGETEQGIYGAIPTDLVLRWASLAARASVSGIVCSALEVCMLRKMREFDEIKLIVPGTRSSGKASGDQARIDTPYSAIRGGADHLVIGRQITMAPDPLRALSELEEEIDRALV